MRAKKNSSPIKDHQACGIIMYGNENPGAVSKVEETAPFAD